MFQALPLTRDGLIRAAVISPMASSREGNPVRTSRLVTISVQVNNGTRSMVTCGARIRSAVHKTVALMMIMPQAAMNTPPTQNDSPKPGE